MEKISKNTNWQITCNRYVGFIDIMGFKDLVLKSTHLEVYNMMIKIEECKSFNENIKWGKLDTKFVTTTNYSDSIMIYSKDDSFNSLDAFSCTISGIIEDLFLANIPFKGAIAFGTMTLDTERSIFFGQPLIDSYLLQEELNFYGVIVHASAEKEFKRHKEKGNGLFFTRYLCPLKNGLSYHLTVHPMKADPYQESKEDKEEFDQLLSAVDRLRERTSGHLRKYIDNTELYLKFVRSNRNL